MASVGLGNNGEHRRSDQISCNCSSSSMEKLKMDDNISDHRRSMSENTNGSSWSHCWDTEDGSLSRLNMESSEELQNLMEDREIASRAVAFVVNSTRKGFVPLCANVASLMKSKRRLEKKVARLKREVEVLCSLNPNGSSKHPTPTSLDSSSDKDIFKDPAHMHIFNELLKENYHCSSASCSRSSSSSQMSNSPKPSKRHAKTVATTSENIPQQALSIPVRFSGDGASRLDDSYETFDPNIIRCQKKLLKVTEGNSGHSPDAENQSALENRTKYHPELQIPDGGKPWGVSSHAGLEAPRINGHCDDDSSMVNVRLASELAASRLEIDRLTLRLKQYEVHNGKNGNSVKLSTCSCQSSPRSAASDVTVTSVASEKRLSNLTDISREDERCSCTPWVLKLPDANEALKDGTSFTNEDDSGLVSASETQTTASETTWDETCSKSESKSSESPPPPSRSHARPLHRSKALNKQGNQSKFKYIHSLQSNDQNDRYLV